MTGNSFYSYSIVIKTFAVCLNSNIILFFVLRRKVFALPRLRSSKKEILPPRLLPSDLRPIFRGRRLKMGVLRSSASNIEDWRKELFDLRLRRSKKWGFRSSDLKKEERREVLRRTLLFFEETAFSCSKSFSQFFGKKPLFFLRYSNAMIEEFSSIFRTEDRVEDRRRFLRKQTIPHLNLAMLSGIYRRSILKTVYSLFLDIPRIQKFHKNKKQSVPCSAATKKRSRLVPLINCAKPRTNCKWTDYRRQVNRRFCFHIQCLRIISFVRVSGETFRRRLFDTFEWIWLCTPKYAFESDWPSRILAPVCLEVLYRWTKSE